jgi:hypothetical protein
VADLDRVRWAVERSSRLDTSVNRLDAIDAEPPGSRQTLLQASRLASPIAAILAHPHHLKTRPPQGEVARTEAPLHARRLALPLAVSCQSMAQAFDLKGTAAKRPWDKMAAWLTPADTAPTWRRRPSVLEQWRGGKRQPVSRKQNRHHHLKAVAYVDTSAATPSCVLPPGINVGADITLLVSMGPQAVKVLAIDPASCWVQVQWEQMNPGFTKSTRTIETYWINPQGLVGISTDKGKEIQKGKEAQ